MTTFLINNIDITRDVIINSFNYMKRIDDVFGTGSFSFESKTIDYNIPPYSVLKIEDKYFLCNSEAIFHYGNQSWFHNVSIIEATSILSRFLVGSKAFSVTGTNTYDYEKINVLLQLINQKYNVKISAKNINSFSKQLEYVFSAGVTLFDALNEIVKNYNYRLNVSKIEDDNIEVDFFDLSNLPREIIYNNTILSKTKIQNAENYCKYLESEATNVIDTTNTTIVDNIYPTSNTIRLSEDTYMLKVPTPIYKVNRMWANMMGEMETRLEFQGEFSYENSTSKTYEEWAELYPVLIDIYDKYYKKYVPDWNKFKNQIWYSHEKTIAPYGGKYDWYIDAEIPLILDLTNRLKSKEQYDLIEDQNKPDYVYYSLGSNVIDGFNIFYKNDFWNTIIGESKKPFFLDMKYIDKNPEGEIYNNILIKNYRVESTSSIFSVTYGLEYYPIANPYLINTKSDLPKNELKYKPYALSYGKSSNYVDFDKISNSMEIENKSIGKVEMIVECDITKMDFLHEFYNIKFQFENEIWYVSNSQYRITSNQSIVTLNLVKNYNKIADVVSLNSQYNTVKNPLQNIIERPLFFEIDDEFVFKNGKTHILVSFLHNPELVDHSVIDFLLFSPVILKNNDETYLYFEMEDQYNSRKRAVEVEGTADEKIEDVPYVDKNNEVYKISLAKLDFENLSYDKAKTLPKIPSGLDDENYQELKKEILIYKDAREKLTFTIKLNNCIIE